MKKTKNFIVVYSTENHDLYNDQFNSREDALDFIENTDDKCVLIEGNDLKTEDYT